MVEQREIIKTLRDAMRRIRSLEETVRLIESKEESVEDNLFRRTEEFRATVEELDEEIKDLNTKILKLENEVSNVKKAIPKLATKSDLEELENFIDLLSPVRSQYVTEADVRRIVREETEE